MTRNEFRILTSGPRVILVLNGRWIADLPWQAALELAQAIRRQAKAAQEIEEHERIAFDQAILLRKGMTFGLTSNRAIQEEAAGLAAWDSRLRRWLPGGIRSTEHVGTPRIHLDDKEP